MYCEAKPEELKPFLGGGKCTEDLKPAARAIFVAGVCWLFCCLDRKRGCTQQGTSVEVKKKSATNGESFWLRIVSTKLPALFLWQDRVRYTGGILL